MLYDLTQKSPPVIVVPYRPEWPAEFRERAAALRRALGGSVVRIDHIGSTSVPGLAAKDIIDIQIGVTDLNDEASWIPKFAAAGFLHRPDIRSDHQPPWFTGDPVHWTKRYVREPANQPRTHMHVRKVGHENQRFALLFRDFLRAQPRFRDLYALVKVRLAELFPASIDSYLYIKDPVVDVIAAAAEDWAKAKSWSLPPADA